MSIQIICGINFIEAQKIHPRNKRNFYIKIYVKPLYINYDYQTLFLCKREAH